MSGSETTQPVLLFGSTGYLGSHLQRHLRERGIPYVPAQSRLEDRAAILAEIERVRPRFILDAAGLTGRPNIDWCEEHRVETLRVNLTGTLNVVDAAYTHGIDVVVFGSGCIYEYDAEHPMRSGIGFREIDPPNFTGSWYSTLRVWLEKALQPYTNVLYLRVRLPLTDDMHERSLLTKLLQYEKVVDVPNSVSVLDDLLPIAIDMGLRGCKGVYNFTNPGVISHNELLGMYRDILHPDFTWKNFTLEEQDKILRARRSNNELDVSKLLAEYPHLPPVTESVRALLYRMRDRMALAAQTRPVP